MEENECYGPASIAFAVIGTFIVTCAILLITAYLYRQWRRNKGKHLVLVTDPEIVEEAYAFDNPCFRDITPGGVGISHKNKNHDRPISMVQIEQPTHTSSKENKWSAPWANLGLGTASKIDKRRTLDDSCVGPKATRVSVVGLRSQDFTGLGFNVCGNMREGIFVKDLLHRGPASESGRIHPGDRIISVKISFRSMVYEDALTILSYASPYDVELEVESGGAGSKPTTLLKKSVGPSSTRICHPLYRSQSIPELSQARKITSKRLFIDQNDSNYSTMNSTIKSSKSTPGVQTLERRHEEAKHNHHPHHLKFGIKVLPALDGTIHRIENQNEHNTNLERRSSKKTDVNGKSSVDIKTINSDDKPKTMIKENIQKRLNDFDNQVLIKKVIQPDPKDFGDFDDHDRTDNVSNKSANKDTNVPTEVPTEVHNAAMAARRNRKSVTDLPKEPAAEIPTPESPEIKSPHKNKRKAPAPPKILTENETQPDDSNKTDEKEIIIEKSNEKRIQKEHKKPMDHHSESESDSELQKSFTNIELDSAHITIHHTPVPGVEDEIEDEDDVYRKAASLGDLSKYENTALTMLERAQSLDMSDPGSKKRKAPLPPEDIHESTEDLTKLDQIDSFDKTRKLKKSSDWGNLEDAIWSGSDQVPDEVSDLSKKKNGSLERSISAFEIKLKEDPSIEESQLSAETKESENSLELYNLPLSKKLTREFIDNERLFDIHADNALARIINDGEIVKSLTPKQVDDDFLKNHLPVSDDIHTVVKKDLSQNLAKKDFSPVKNDTSPEDDFEDTIDYFDMYTKNSTSLLDEIKIELQKPEELYAGKKEIVEEPMSKVIVKYECPGCKRRHEKHNEDCKSGLVNKDEHEKQVESSSPKVSYHQTIKVEDTVSKNNADFETHFAKPIVNISNDKSDDLTKEIYLEEEDDSFESNSTITVNNQSVPTNVEKRHNVSNVSISSHESEDVELKPPLPTSPMPQNTAQKMTYVTEIKVSSDDQNLTEYEGDNEELETKKSSDEITVTSNGKIPISKKPPVPPRRTDAPKFIKSDSFPDRQVVYVSEYKSAQSEESKDEEENKGQQNYIYLKENKEQNSGWSNGATPSQPVTNIVLSLGDDNVVKK